MCPADRAQNTDYATATSPNEPSFPYHDVYVAGGITYFCDDIGKVIAYKPANMAVIEPVEGMWPAVGCGVVGVPGSNMI